MAQLKDLQSAKDERERSVWMTMRFPEGTSKAGQPIESGDGKPWRVLVKNAWCQAYQQELKKFNWQREFYLKFEAIANEQDAEQKQRMLAAIGVTEEFLTFEERGFREHLICDWADLYDGDEAIGCSPANIKRILFEEYPELFPQVKEFANDGKNFGMKDSQSLITSPAEMLGDIEKKALNGSDSAPDADLLSQTETVDSEMDTPMSEHLHVEASLPALA